MELSKNYTPTETEAKWYKHWLSKDYFKSMPDERVPFTITIPPPNVTGVLHMGHCLNSTIQDILVRDARAQGKNACWVPGTDHASIATEAKVVGMLRERGITKSSLSREEFLGYAWEWKEKYGGIILQQLKKLGCSLDWDRVSFTMDEGYYASVVQVFVELYNKGYIYRGKRMINWDVRAKTALSDEEVIRKETKQNLYHIAYPIVDENGVSVEGGPQSVAHITIATVRPETIMGDSAICVHPLDERYQHLHGKFALIPLIGRAIPIIVDEYVDREFGTGCLKVTPAHDVNDYNLGIKHNLPVIDVLNDDGTLSEAAQIFVGMERFEARKKVVERLEKEGFLVKAESYTSEVGHSERTDTVVEPRLSMQWWVRMKQLAEPALEAVLDNEIAFYPTKFVGTYRHWMENIKDWCISRQLWWGHRIPAWYDNEGNVFVANDVLEAERQWHEKFPEKSDITPLLFQDEDCLDTWFSSWLWPFEVFHGLSDAGNKDVGYYYPTDVLVTAPEIIFFWVARMIMAGKMFTGKIPFKTVYFTGIVRDKLGRKMSKSLGNSPDLLGLIDQYGADAVRFGIMIASPAGNDILFDEGALEQGRNFNNKLWNALKLVKIWEGRVDNGNKVEGVGQDFALVWFENRLGSARAEIAELMAQFKLSEALKSLYSLIWDDFCNWYLEWAKPGFDQPIPGLVFERTVVYFESLLLALHPFMPFITEEIYHLLREQKEDLCKKQSLAATPSDKGALAKGDLLKHAITAIREAKVKGNIKNKDVMHLKILTSNAEVFTPIQAILAKQVNANSVEFITVPLANTVVVTLEEDRFYLVSENAADNSHQIEELRKELAYQQGFLESVLKKINNEKFMKNAKPEVIANEMKKKGDAEARIRTILENLGQ